MGTWEADDARRRHMARFGRRDTAPELALRRELHRRGRRFFVDRRREQSVPRSARPRVPTCTDRGLRRRGFGTSARSTPTFRRANAELWRRKLLANRQRDAQNQAILVSEGWRVFRFW